VSLGFGIGAAATPARITIGSGQIILLDGKPVFPIGFTKAPAPDAKTPSGVSAYKELKSNGTVFHLAGPQPRKWGREAEAELDRILKSSSEAGLLVAISIPIFRQSDLPTSEKRTNYGVSLKNTETIQGWAFGRQAMSRNGARYQWRTFKNTTTSFIS
jgi:hypothetical protein